MKKGSWTLDSLNTTQKISALQSTVSEISRITGKNTHLKKLEFFFKANLQRAEVFLCCIQCINAHPLNYQNQQPNIFSD